MPIFKYKQATINPTWAFAIAAFYIGILLNFHFFQQAWKLIFFEHIDARSVLFYFSMPVLSWAAIFIILNIAAVVWLDRPIIILFIFLSSLAEYFMSNYGIIIDSSIIASIMETTASESFALLTPQLVIWVLITIILPTALLLLIGFTRQPSMWKMLLLRIGSVLITSLVIFFIAQLFYKNYDYLFRNNKVLAKSLSPLNSISASLSWYHHHQRAKSPFIRIGLDAKQRPDMKGVKPRLTILIVGESTRAQSFGLENHERQTTPLLAKDDVIYYPQTQACGTLTLTSVPCMFSGMGRKHYNDKLASHRENVLDILQRAGVNVLWRENDNGCKNVCDRILTQDMNDFHLSDMCINGECYDEVLFHNLSNYIDQMHSDGVIVLHTIGSHGPTYSHRYPPSFRKFTPTCDTNEIQYCSSEQLKNTYDNTILYVDYIVDKAINILRANQNRFSTSLIYLSDHGESLGEKGVYLHGLPYWIAPTEQTRVPLLLWLSDDYQQRYHISKRCLQEQRLKKNISQDNLFPTLLGLFDITTQQYQPELDLLNICRRSQ